MADNSDPSPIEGDAPKGREHPDYLDLDPDAQAKRYKRRFRAGLRRTLYSTGVTSRQPRGLRGGGRPQEVRIAAPVFRSGNEPAFDVADRNELTLRMHGITRAASIALQTPLNDRLVAALLTHREVETGIQHPKAGVLSMRWGYAMERAVTLLALRDPVLGPRMSAQVSLSNKMQDGTVTKNRPDFTLMGLVPPTGDPAIDDARDPDPSVILYYDLTTERAVNAHWNRPGYGPTVVQMTHWTPVDVLDRITRAHVEQNRPASGPVPPIAWPPKNSGLKTFAAKAAHVPIEPLMTAIAENVLHSHRRPDLAGLSSWAATTGYELPAAPPSRLLDAPKRTAEAQVFGSPGN